MISRMCVMLACFFMVWINHGVNGFFKNTPKFQVTSKPFKFRYVEGDFLNMDLSFKMPPEAISGFVVLQYSPTDPRPIRTTEIRRPNNKTGDPVATITGFMSSEHVYIDVHLYNKTGVILNKRIAEGTAVKSALNSNDLDSTYSLICLNGEKCQVEADLRKQSEDTPKVQDTNKLFKFGYVEDHYLQMDLSFKMPPDVTGGHVVLHYSPTDPRPKRTFQIKRPNDKTGDPVATITGFMSSEHVYIDVHLYNKTGVILNKRIAEGTAVKSALNSNDLDSTYSLICLNGEKCEVKADLRKQSEDSLIGFNGENCEVEADLRKQTEDADIKETQTKKDYTMIIIISLSAFAMAMLVLAIVSFTKSCSFKRGTPEILQVTLQKRNPFYANVLFRKECQEIIDDLEQNQYELLDPFERR